MTSEQKANLVRNGIILLLVISIPAVVFTPRKAKPMEKEHKTATEVIQTTTAEGGHV